ncbi:MAG: winged helix-turn-helix transcriptional regulator [Nitrospiraceae bacterium]|nr:winged helix-turn-helix transcriptional regulator [Nitrospiraceae bacterium]
MQPLLKIDQHSLPDRLVTGLSKIGLAMKSRPWRRQGQQGVGPLQMQVLTILRGRPNQSATVSAIARELSVKLPTASEVIRTLEHKRLVRRRRQEVDNRVVTVHLTAKGAKAGHAENGWPEILSAATQELSPLEQTSLLKILIKLIRALQVQGEIPVARMCVSCEHFQPHVYANAEQPHHCQFVNAPIGEQALRLDCPDYLPASVAQAKEAWTRYRQPVVS